MAVLPLVLGVRHLNPLLPGSVSAASAYAAGDVISQTTGIVLASIAILTLAGSIAASNARRRREQAQAERQYQQEIRAAEARGERRARAETQQAMDSLRRDLDWTRRDMEHYRDQATSLWVQFGSRGPFPHPPSRQREDPEPAG
jgi:hypothetical protein